MYSLKESIERNVNVAILLISRGQKNWNGWRSEFRSNTLYQTRHPVLSVPWWIHQADPPSNKRTRPRRHSTASSARRFQARKIDVQALLLKMSKQYPSQSVQRLQNISHNRCWHGPASVDPLLYPTKQSQALSGPELAPVVATRPASLISCDASSPAMCINKAPTVCPRPGQINYIEDRNGLGCEVNINRAFNIKNLGAMILPVHTGLQSSYPPRLPLPTNFQFDPSMGKVNQLWLEKSHFKNTCTSTTRHWS